jgi:hypothetical protein
VPNHKIALFISPSVHTHLPERPPPDDGERLEVHDPLALPPQPVVLRLSPLQLAQQLAPVTLIPVRRGQLEALPSAVRRGPKTRTPAASSWHQQYLPPDRVQGRPCKEHSPEPLHPALLDGVVAEY